jgi:hypothetical protein
LSERPSTVNKQANLLRDATKSFADFTCVKITPVTYNGDALVGIVEELSRRTNIRKLTINSSCMDENKMSSLANMSTMDTLSLIDPTRAALDILPTWLAKLKLLRHLHLTGNCGSVTPGVLRALTPQSSSIRSLSLGLSYSLTHDDVFAALLELPELTYLRLRYYHVRSSNKCLCSELTQLRFTAEQVAKTPSEAA